IRNLSGKRFHIRRKSNRSRKDVTIACPSTCHDPATLRSLAVRGALLKTCSEYRPSKWSKPEFIFVKKSSSRPAKACEIATKSVPHEAQNLISIELSFPQVGQNIM